MMSKLKLNQTNFKDFFLSKQMLELQAKVKTISLNKSYPFITYFGVNFRKEQLISVKAYFTFYQKLSIPEISSLIKDTKNILCTYTSYEPSKVIDLQNTGCAFSIKRDEYGQFCYGYHHRFKSKSNLFQNPLRIEMTEEDLLNFQGISYEYNHKGVGHQKNYYYLTSEKTKAMLAQRAKNESVQEASLIEYTETNKNDKIIIWDAEISGMNQRVKIDFSDEHLLLNDWIFSQFGLKASFYGMYFDSSIRSCYFMNSKSIQPFEVGLENNFDTINHIQSKIQM